MLSMPAAVPEARARYGAATCRQRGPVSANLAIHPTAARASRDLPMLGTNVHASAERGDPAQVARLSYGAISRRLQSLRIPAPRPHQKRLGKHRVIPAPSAWSVLQAL